MAARTAVLVVGWAWLAAAMGCGEGSGPGAPAPRRGLEDKPLAAFQRDLLDLAFDSASAIWLYPHIKDRARAQEAVIRTCLELDQPKRALRYIEQVPNWRRGMGYADLAFHLAEKGHGPDEVQPYLDLAVEHGKDPKQEWRFDSVRVRIAETYLRLGQPEKAATFAARLDPAVEGKVTGAAGGSFEEQMAALGPLLASGHYDVKQNALESAARLFDRFYSSADQRGKVEEAMRASWERMALVARIDLLAAMSASAAGHADRTKALELAGEAQAVMDGARWDLEHYVPVAARVAAARFRAGDKEKALADAKAILARFDAEKGTILETFRAGAIRPLAEAFQAMGDPATALEVYRRVVEEGVANANHRPRAEDLAATSASMARHAVEPEAALWGRMREILKALREQPGPSVKQG
jgi:hypothetical protein